MSDLKPGQKAACTLDGISCLLVGFETTRPMQRFTGRVSIKATFPCPRCSAEHTYNFDTDEWSNVRIEQAYDDDAEPYDIEVCAKCYAPFSPETKEEDMYVAGHGTVRVSLKLQRLPADHNKPLKLVCPSRPELNGEFLLESWNSMTFDAQLVGR